MNLRDQRWKNAHTLVKITDIFSWKFSVKVFLMLDNPFLVPSLCKLNYISLCFVQISTKSPAKLLIPFKESTVFFLSLPRCFGPHGKFQHNINISIKTAHVSKLSVSCDYGFMQIYVVFYMFVRVCSLFYDLCFIFGLGYMCLIHFHWVVLFQVQQEPVLLKLLFDSQHYKLSGFI